MEELVCSEFEMDLLLNQDLLEKGADVGSWALHVLVVVRSPHRDMITAPHNQYLTTGRKSH